MDFLSIFIAVLPVVLIGIYIYKKDKIKESKSLILKLFLFGIFSCFPAVLFGSIIGNFFPKIEDMNFFELFLYCFIAISLIEELSKWFFTYKLTYYHIEFDSLYDMIVYAVFISLGFSFLENILYVKEYGIMTGILRGFLSVPGHACDGVFMGYYLGLAKTSALNNRDNLKKKNLLLSVLVPTIMHGIYDFCLFTGNLLLIIFFFVFVIYVYVHSVKKIKKVSSIDGKIGYRDKICLDCGCVVNGNYCSNCGRKYE